MTNKLRSVDKWYELRKRLSSWMISFWGIDGRISIQLYILIITFISINMLNEVQLLWMINSVTMPTIYCDFMIIHSSLHFNLLYISGDVSGCTRNETFYRQALSYFILNIMAWKSPFCHTYHLGESIVYNSGLGNIGTLYSVGKVCKDKWERKKAYYILRISL